MNGGEEGTSQGGESAQITELMKSMALQSKTMATQMELLTKLQDELTALRRESRETQSTQSALVYDLVNKGILEDKDKKEEPELISVLI